MTSLLNNDLAGEIGRLYITKAERRVSHNRKIKGVNQVRALPL
jgi:hypothetical protein